ncbi:MAG: efflux RND transporter periplasmic adaptor subunit [Planctomycetes bacterium]|nr:efflux RND transporter periplasmic adaptor subunit [Planctomycetota bacterium]
MSDHNSESGPIRRPHGRRATVLLALATAASTWVAAVAQESPARGGLSADAADTLTGFTAPFRTVTLAAVRTGRIQAIPLAEGTLAQSGAVAVLLDDQVQQRRVAISKALAESNLEIDLAQVRLRQAQNELERLRKIGVDAYATTKELSDAQTAVDTARVALAQAQFRHEQAQREHALQQALLDELRVRAPFPGYVAERLKEVGETVEEREGILTLVQLDPLLVTVDCALDLAAQLRPGQQVAVQPRAAPGTTRVGEVSLINRVADPASQTCKVKISVPNPDNGWIAGARVAIVLEEAAVARATRFGQADALQTAQTAKYEPMP